MLNCRSIPKATWEQAHKALVFFFSRRYGVDDAEDLAQETLATLWAREDFVFSEEKDFLLVCYGFAKRILLEGYRDRRRNEHNCEDMELAARHRFTNAMSQPELEVLLGEVYAIGSTQLKPLEWRLIELAATTDRSTIGSELGLGDANNVRVHLHRARRKLAKLVGWNRNGL